MHIYIYTGFPMALVVKKLPANAGHARDTGSIPWLGRPPGEGNGNLLQQENFPWTEEPGRLQAKSQTRLSTRTYTVYIYMYYKCNKWWQIQPKVQQIFIFLFPDCKVFTGKWLPSQGLHFPASLVSGWPHVTIPTNGIEAEVRRGGLLPGWGGNFSFICQLCKMLQETQTNLLANSIEAETPKP